MTPREIILWNALVRIGGCLRITAAMTPTEWSRVRSEVLEEVDRATKEFKNAN